MRNSAALEMNFVEDEVLQIDRKLPLVPSVAPPRYEERLCVLLVEDDAADAYLIKRALAKNPRVGEVVIARDGVEALEVIELRAMQPDLAIVDLHMPRKDGFALLREFASRGAVNFPSVVLTSSRGGADALRAKKRGATACLAKPKTVAELTSALDVVIAGLSRGG